VIPPASDIILKPEATKEELLRDLPHARSLVLAFSKGKLAQWWLSQFSFENVVWGVESAFLLGNPLVDSVRTYVGNDYHGPELRREVRRKGELFEMSDGFGKWVPVNLYLQHQMLD
jgi:hypothetical protein